MIDECILGEYEFILNIKNKMLNIRNKEIVALGVPKL